MTWPMNYIVRKKIASLFTAWPFPGLYISYNEEMFFFLLASLLSIIRQSVLVGRKIKVQTTCDDIWPGGGGVVVPPNPVRRRQGV